MMDLCDSVNKTLSKVFDMKLDNSTQLYEKMGLYNIILYKNECFFVVDVYTEKDFRPLNLKNVKFVKIKNMVVDNKISIMLNDEKYLDIVFDNCIITGFCKTQDSYYIHGYNDFKYYFENCIFL